MSQLSIKLIVDTICIVNYLTSRIFSTILKYYILVWHFVCRTQIWKQAFSSVRFNIICWETVGFTFWPTLFTIFRQYQYAKPLCTSGGWHSHRTAHESWCEPQTMSRIVDSCLQTKFADGLTIPHGADEDAVNWLNSLAIAALAKYDWYGATTNGL